MQELVARFGKAVKGVLSGFERIVFQGTILPLAHEAGAMSFLGWRGVLNRDYKIPGLPQNLWVSCGILRYSASTKWRRRSVTDKEWRQSVSFKCSRSAERTLRRTLCPHTSSFTLRRTASSFSGPRLCYLDTRSLSLRILPIPSAILQNSRVRRYLSWFLAHRFCGGAKKNGSSRKCVLGSWRGDYGRISLSRSSSRSSSKRSLSRSLCRSSSDLLGRYA